MRILKEVVVSLTVALTITSAALAQRRATRAKPDESNVAIALQIAGQAYRFDGNAVCQHDPIASIYSVRAESWSVHQADGERRISLTLWRPKDGSGDMLSLSAANGGKTYVVNTIKTDRGNPAQGSARVIVTSSGAGGTFTINATATNGAAITGTIKCSGFTATWAEGG